MSHKKFNNQTSGKYWENYFSNDQEFYKTIQDHIKEFLPQDSKIGIDIGAGPGIGAKLISDLNIKTQLTGYEPSKTNEEGGKLSKELRLENNPTTYTPINAGIKEIKNLKEESIDYILILRAAHEISESLGSKQEFFNELKKIVNSLKSSGIMIIAEPQYPKKDNSEQIIKEVQRYQLDKIGHSHDPSDYIPSKEMEEELSKLGLKKVKETILPNNKLLQHLIKKGFDIKNSPCSFYIQTFKKAD